jgi:hypothetical protein
MTRMMVVVYMVLSLITSELKVNENSELQKEFKTDNGFMSIACENGIENRDKIIKLQQEVRGVQHVLIALSLHTKGQLGFNCELIGLLYNDTNFKATVIKGNMRG